MNSSIANPRPPFPFLIVFGAASCATTMLALVISLAAAILFRGLLPWYLSIALPIAAAAAGALAALLLTAIAALLRLLLPRAIDERVAIPISIVVGALMMLRAVDPFSRGGALTAYLVGAVVFSSLWSRAALRRAGVVGSRIAAWGIVPLAIGLGAAAIVPRTLQPRLMQRIDAARLEPEARSTVGWPSSAPRPKNVILVVVDTLRADHLSAYGYERATSPHLERLAAQGVTFEQAAAQYTLTSASVASILTGTYPATHGLVSCGAVLGAAQKSIAEQFRAAGFHTAAFAGNPNLDRAFGFDRGFDDYIESFREMRQPPGRVINAKLLPWLRERREKPFFAYVHYVDPHAAYAPEPPYRDRFLNDALAHRLKGMSLSLQRGRWRIPNEAVLDGETDPNVYVQRYDEEVLSADAAIGELLAELDRQQLAASTLVIVTADHGESMVEHEVLFNHGKHAYQNNAHVPLIVRLPGAIPAARRLSSLVELVDVAPTLIDLFGLPRVVAHEGQSLAPLLIGQEGWVKGTQRIEAGHAAKIPSCALRRGRWKAIYNERGVEPAEMLNGSELLRPESWRRLWLGLTDHQPQRMRWELYDLQTDPQEQHNLARQERDRLATLGAELIAWRATMPTDRKIGIDREAATPELLDQLRNLGYAH